MAPEGMEPLGGMMGGSVTDALNRMRTNSTGSVTDTLKRLRADSMDPSSAKKESTLPPRGTMRSMAGCSPRNYPGMGPDGMPLSSLDVMGGSVKDALNRLRADSTGSVTDTLKKLRADSMDPSKF